ncbi:MAG TPA: sugar phosphate isomerase/epimerase [Candidatus Eisenbergiella merdipullorum]|uniref:Sugar phosphate isomerase/epimerase n=1 Tax=Candidatus Eisenbergiella merdipullorum TaxID=2838553 RepID=A0A9D2I5H1_9FIRM|nr:sugar phosphate isomerase/epimerase [Candidatus Eisenbergiella merdipullorum]
MKIGTCVSLNTMDDIEQKLETLQKNGFDSCQLLAWNPAVWTKENAVRLQELLDQYDICVSAFWCGWEGPKVWDFYDGQLTLGLVPPEYRRMRVQNLCDGADFAHLLGLTDVVTHMGFIPENPNDPNFGSFCVAVRTVAEHLKKNGQFLLFETGQETPVTMLRCFERVGMDNLGINLDTANLILYGKANPVDALDVFGKYVRNLHAKDGLYPVNGHDLGQEVPIGEGKVDFHALFKKLHELGYDSYVTIEREIDGPQQLTDILRSRDYLQAVIDEIYTA